MSPERKEEIDRAFKTALMPTVSKISEEHQEFEKELCI